MPELIRSGVNGFLVERELDALVQAVRTACAEHPRLAAEMQRDVRAWGWKERSAAFYDAFGEVLAPARRRPAKKVDLRDQVTAFVTTVGAPSYGACRRHLQLQDCRFRLHTFRRVAPMNAAFQRMLDACETPFFVQVDEDMLLYRHAVRRLYERIAAAPDSVALLIGELYDAHLERSIHGVKIYRHAVVRRYPFADVQSFEKEQVQRMRADGWVVASDPVQREPSHERTLGLHGTHWTPASIYERYATLESRRRRYPRELAWFAEYPSIFLRRLLEDPSELNFFALMGVLSAALMDARGDGADKDFRRFRSLPGLREARRLFDGLRRAPGEAGVAPPRVASAADVIGAALAAFPAPATGGGG